MSLEPYQPRSRAVRVEPGTRLGSYEILLCVGRGGMASVWAARQHGARGFSRLVALKTILPELAAPDLDVMFLDEARVTARIHHPNVCEVFELIEHQGVLALSMEWVDGDTLNNVLSSRPRNPALDARIAAQICAHVAHGLHAAHELRDERGAPLELVHRDVSPQNILISRTGHVKVTDFGVAKSLGGVREATAVGKVKGKLSYMSPEQAQGKLVDRRSDVFSLGVVLYLATVGSHPFRRPGESRHQQLSRLVQNRVKPPSELVKNYPPELEAILLRALQRNPAARQQTAEELARELTLWVLTSGPLVTEQHIARTLLDRSGAAILERSECIANLMTKARDEQDERGADAAGTPTDPTLVPTTSRAAMVGPGRGRGAGATLRAVSMTLTGAALAIAAGFIFSTPSDPAGFELRARSGAAAPGDAMASLPSAAANGSLPVPNDALPARAAGPALPGLAGAAGAPSGAAAAAPSSDTAARAAPARPAPSPTAASAQRASTAQRSTARRSTKTKASSKARSHKRRRATDIRSGR